MKKIAWLIICLALAACAAPGPTPTETAAPAQPAGRPYRSGQPYLEALFPAGYSLSAPDPGQAQSLVSARSPQGASVIILARQLQQAMDLQKLGQALVRVDQGQLRSQQGVQAFGEAQPARLGSVPTLTYTYSLAGLEHRRLLAVSGGWLYTLDLSGPPAARDDLTSVLASIRLVAEAAPVPATALAAPGAPASPASLAQLRPLLDSLDPPRLSQALAQAGQARAGAAGDAYLASQEAEAGALLFLVLRGQKRTPPALDLARLLEQARAALSAHKDSADMQRAWGLILLANERAGEAEEALERAAKLGPSQAANILAQALWYGFDPASQESHARRALALEPRLIGAQWLLARALESQNRLPEAETALTALLARDPQHSLALQAAGSLALERDPGQAQTQLQKALSLDPNNLNARFNLALSLKRGGKASQAEAELDKLLAADPRDASAHNLRGQVQQEQGRLPQARASFQAATQANPQYAQAFYNLGALCAGQLDDLACAKAAFSRFVELEPSGPRSQRIRDWLSRQGR